MNENGQPMAPIEVHLNSCAIDVFDLEQNGEKMKQVRITHTSGVPVTLVLLLTEQGARAVAAQLRGDKPILLASEIPRIDGS